MAPGVLDQHIIFEVATYATLLQLIIIIIIYCHKANAVTLRNSLNMQVWAFTNIANADIG